MKSAIFRDKRPLLLFLLPAFMFLTLFLYYPFIQNIINSFMNISGLGTASQGAIDPWYGNYLKMYQDANMKTALQNTMILTLCTVFIQVGIALILALMVDGIKKGAQLFRTVYFFPIVISATALGLMFNLVFLYNGGMLNQFMQKFFGVAKNIDWKDEQHFLGTMLTPVMWQYIGFYFVVLVTGLSSISLEMYEAAEIDGASRIQRIRYITLPMLRNVISTCLILAITGALKVFDLPWVMMGAGIPLDRSWLLGTYMYNQAFLRGDVDYSSAIAVVIVVLGVVFAKTANALFKQKEY